VNFRSLFLLYTSFVFYNLLEKIAHTSLVCVVEFHINPRSYEGMKSILVGGLALDVFLATFLLLFDIFKVILQTQ